MSEDAILTLTDINGKLLASKHLSTGSNEVSIANLNSGIYIGIINQGSQTVRLKLIKE
jgi:hypothetical protein